MTVRSTAINSPWESRTPIFAVKGQRLNRLTNEPYSHTTHKGIPKNLQAGLSVMLKQFT